MKPKRTLSFLLAIMMMLSLLPVNLVSVSASETTTTEKNITLGTSALKGGQASNVYFGNYQQSSLGNTEPTEGTEGIDWIKNSNGQINGQGAYYKKDPIKWRVLSNADGKAFLLSDKNLDVVRYHEDDEPVTWEISTIRSWLNGYGASLNTGGESGIDYTSDNFIGSAFSTAEKGAIAETNVVNDNNPAHNTLGGNNTTDKVFLLSIAEAQNTSYFADDNSKIAINTVYVYGGGKTGTDSMRNIYTADWWWLRSPGLLRSSAAYFDDVVASYGDHVYYEFFGVRPAFNLNLSSVLFTSAAVDGKSATVGTLSANAENTGNEYKLTIKDSSRSEFTAKAIDVSENTFTVSYTNAKAGENEYISAIIVNADGEVTHYGKLTRATSQSGFAILDLAGVTLASTDKIYIFNEQVNGDYKTDFASELKEIEKTATGETQIILTSDKVSAYLVGNNATLNVASYKGEELKDAKTISVTSKIYEKTLAEIGLDTNGADSIKAFLWTDMDDIIPLCEGQEVILNQNAS